MWYQNAWFFSVRGFLMKKSLKRSFCFLLRGKVDSQWLSFKLSTLQEKFLPKETLLCLSHHFVLFLDCFENQWISLGNFVFPKKNAYEGEVKKHSRLFITNFVVDLLFIYFFSYNSKTNFKLGIFLRDA